MHTPMQMSPDGQHDEPAESCCTIAIATSVASIGIQNPIQFPRNYLSLRIIFLKFRINLEDILQYSGRQMGSMMSLQRFAVQERL